MRSGWASVWALASALALGACEDDDAGYKPLHCYEVIPGEVVDPDISRASASRVIAQAAVDYSLAAGAASSELAAQCSSIAIDLGGGPAEIDAALTQLDLGVRAVKVCAVAEAAIERHGTSRLTAPLPTCTTSSALVAACLKQCVPASDDCTLACDASARASAECEAPVDLRFGRVLSLRARLGLMAEDLGKLDAAERMNVNVKAACIPLLVFKTSTASATITRLVDAADKVIAAAREP